MHVSDKASVVLRLVMVLVLVNDVVMVFMPLLHNEHVNSDATNHSHELLRGMVRRRDDDKGRSGSSGGIGESLLLFLSFLAFRRNAFSMTRLADWSPILQRTNRSSCTTSFRA